MKVLNKIENSKTNLIIQPKCDIELKKRSDKSFQENHFRNEERNMKIIKFTSLQQTSNNRVKDKI